MAKEPSVGDVVIYCDEKLVDHNALVLAVWGPECVNLIFVANDGKKQDQYGRQTQHESSVSKGGASNVAHGRYWRFADEEKVAIATPKSV